VEAERIPSRESAEVAVIELGEDEDHRTLCGDVDFESRRAVFHSPWYWYLDPAVCDGPASVEKAGTIEVIEFVQEVVVYSCC